MSLKINEKLSYPVNDVYVGENYYLDYLTGKACSRFIYENLPATIPAYELERMLVGSQTQKVLIVDKNGKQYVQPYQGYGVGVYEDTEPNSIYANPILGSGNVKTNLLDIDNSNVLFENYNNNNLYSTIRRYAKKLAQYDSSIDINTVNTRNVAIPVASDSGAKASLEEFIRKIQAGVYAVLQSNKQNVLLNEETYKYVPTVPNSYFKEMTELATMRNNELRMFLFEIGFIMPKDKQEAVLSDESSNDKILPLINLTSELQAREDNIERMNALYGWNASVKLNPILEKMYDDFLSNKPEEPGEPEEPEEAKEKEEDKENE